MQWHWSNLLATWQYWEDSPVKTLDVSVVDGSDGLDAKQWGAMVILTSLSFLSSVVSVVLKGASRYTSSNSGNALNVAFVSDDEQSDILGQEEDISEEVWIKGEQLKCFGIFGMDLNNQGICSSDKVQPGFQQGVDQSELYGKNLLSNVCSSNPTMLQDVILFQNQGQVDKLEVSSSMCFAKVGGKRQSVAADNFPIQDGNSMETGNTGTPKNTLEGLFEMDKEDISIGKAKEEGLDALREALCAKRNMLIALETELENERNAAAIATSEAMAMISRLHEEKSAMQLEVAQFQRMAEEKTEYDEHAMALLKETLFK
ncbi:hypothetical protein L7F22_028385 [Adiantum nelumboides]|nr:hypothetical protein [Adiantum nelumboides]